MAQPGTSAYGPRPRQDGVRWLASIDGEPPMATTWLAIRLAADANECGVMVGTLPPQDRDNLDLMRLAARAACDRMVNLIAPDDPVELPPGAGRAIMERVGQQVDNVASWDRVTWMLDDRPTTARAWTFCSTWVGVLIPNQAHVGTGTGTSAAVAAVGVGLDPDELSLSLVTDINAYTTEINSPSDDNARDNNAVVPRTMPRPNKAFVHSDILRLLP